MADVTCDVNDFYENVMAMCSAFVDECEGQLRDDIYAAADSCRDELRESSGRYSQQEDLPERQRLAYERGWKAYHHKPVDGHVEAVVANAAAPGLTHLIEKGHELFVFGHDTGKRTQARPHIAEAYQHAASRHFGA